MSQNVIFKSYNGRATEQEINVGVVHLKEQKDNHSRISLTCWNTNVIIWSVKRLFFLFNSTTFLKRSLKSSQMFKYLKLYKHHNTKNLVLQYLNKYMHLLCMEIPSIAS